MARDYQRKPAPRGKAATARRKSASKGSVIPGWLLMLTGFLPGAFLAVLVHLHHQGGGSASGLVTSSGSGNSKSAASGPAADEDTRPRFEFYKLLSEMEVVVPDEPEEFTRRSRAEQPAPPPPSVSAPAVTSPTPGTSSPGRPQPDAGSGEGEPQYLVQAGSFRNQGDADRLKARLALMGVESEIQSVKHGGETWHRVRIGPIASRSRVDDVRKRLEQEKVDSILLRVQG